MRKPPPSGGGEFTQKYKMYNEENLWKKVEGHIKENESPLLKALISDINEFNTLFKDDSIELYIDFDNVGTFSEGDTYETFSIRMHGDDGDENVHSGLNIHQLDDCLCALESCLKVLRGKPSNL